MGFNILESGMVTSVGYSRAATCAAIRARLDNHQETRFMFDGEWLLGAMVGFSDHVRGREKLLQMVVPAVQECLDALPVGTPQDTVLAVCVAEEDRAERFEALDRSFSLEVERRLGHARLEDVVLFHGGRLGAVDALLWAEKRLTEARLRYAVVAGVDSMLTTGTQTTAHGQRRLLTVDNSDGFIPGEAAAAVLISELSSARDPFQCLGIGLATESATLESGQPLRGDGLARAYRVAFDEARCDFRDIDYRLTDIAGTQYEFKDAALALSRTMRVRKSFFDLWHPADCVGEVGAASVPLVLGVALEAERKGYAPGPGVLCHFSDDRGRRAAAVVRQRGKRSHPSMD